MNRRRHLIHRLIRWTRSRLASLTTAAGGSVPRRTRDELIADSKHVLYEAQQLDNVVQGLMGIEFGANAKVPDWLTNALLEDVGLHARALILFLYDKPREKFPGDVLAVDYLPEWPGVRPAESEFLRTVRPGRQGDGAHHPAPGDDRRRAARMELWEGPH